MAINLGNSSRVQSLRLSNQRKIQKTTEGKLILFARVGTGTDDYIKYKTSSDDGDTWDANWTIVTGLQYYAGCSTSIDDNNDINLISLYIYFNSQTPRFKKMTYSEGDWTPGATVTVDASNKVDGVIIDRRANGDLWICSRYYTSGSNIRTYYSTNEGVNWNSVTFFSSLVNSVDMIMVGSEVWAIAQRDSKLTLYKYTTSWDGGNDIVESGITNDLSGHGISVLKITDDYIFVTARTTSGIKVFMYSGGSWDSGILISDNADDTQACITNLNSQPVVIWKNYQHDIYYSYFNGSSWSTPDNITDDTDSQYPTVLKEDDNYVYVAWMSKSSPYPIYFEKIEITIPIQKTITSDAHIKAIDIQKTITSDANVTISVQKTITSDAFIKIVGEQKTILSDAKIVDRYQKTITSDTKVVDRYIKTILSNAKIILEDTFVDINNKFNSVRRVLSNINNFFNSVKSNIFDINNDFRTQKRELYDINNDFRMLKSWQLPGDAGFQSLGKTYIKLYIATVEQTDTDVDSIRIIKNINGAHTATFDLGRAYDASKPAIESLVEIKYHVWTLYKGYITEISPAENPESITVRCQNKYWLNNRTNKYFFVGHKPQDDKEKYYDTIQGAISSEFSLSLDIGNFVPQTMNCFAQGQSDILTSLISESGNYGWFYDVDESFKLWKAGEGSIIDIGRQTIGANAGLYQLVEHQFNENVSGIINKLRVQMGEKVIRTFNDTGGNRTYTGHNYSNFQGFLIPAWGSSYERLAKNSADGYGWDYPEPGYEKEFGEVFKKYYIPYLDTELSSWSDRYPPRIDIHSPGGYYYSNIGTITEGFTIDYENRTIIFNEPQYLYKTNTRGEMTSVRASLLKLFLWKKNYYTFTEDPADNPEVDISNPLMFFTDKMGSYPTTVIKDLNLSTLSIQEGYSYTDEEGVVQVIPSWDDTDFAEDYADWELSKTCDKKIIGNIILVLDAVCFYNIDLTKRIYIDGITESAMNIKSMSYNLSDFKITLELQNNRSYKRTASLISRGE